MHLAQYVGSCCNMPASLSRNSSWKSHCPVGSLGHQHSAHAQLLLQNGPPCIPTRACKPQQRVAYAGELESKDGVAEKVRALAEVVLAESCGSASEPADAALQRCAAEMFAFAACIGSDSFASQLVRAVCHAAAESTSSAR